METGDWGKKDRLSHRTSIGVVGNGFVGGAVVNGFGTYCIVNVLIQTQTDAITPITKLYFPILCLFVYQLQC